ncbi:hypothetical protein JCM14076_11920 [Methylosoma difficile]
MNQKNELAELAQIAEQVLECFNAAAAVIGASNLDPKQAKEHRRLWGNIYLSACDVLSNIGDICPELDPLSPQRLHEHLQNIKNQTEP